MHPELFERKKEKSPAVSQLQERRHSDQQIALRWLQTVTVIPGHTRVTKLGTAPVRYLSLPLSLSVSLSADFK